ncbi:MAG TPA: hypothetical protein VH370_01230 [Humisphaera sp.]|jgi:hypothetical protein|nr:hypothetical protein [Humisphaera sp.]
MNLLKRILVRLITIGGIVGLLVSAFVLIFWSWLDSFNFFHAQASGLPKQMVGMAVGSFTALGVGIYDELKRIMPERSVEGVYFEQINEAVKAAFKNRRGRRNGHVRIFASTSEIIAPAIRESRERIAKCEILLQHFDPNSSIPKDRVMAGKVQMFTQSWKDRVRQRQIDELSVWTYSGHPQMYFIIIDDDALVTGLFYTSADDSHTVAFMEPLLINGSSPTACQIIHNYILYFEHVIELSGDPMCTAGRSHEV